jgi:hypothetical protein
MGVEDRTASAEVLEQSGNDGRQHRGTVWLMMLVREHHAGKRPAHKIDRRKQSPRLPVRTVGMRLKPHQDDRHSHSSAGLKSRAQARRHNFFTKRIDNNETLCN